MSITFPCHNRGQIHRRKVKEEVEYFKENDPEIPVLGWFLNQKQVPSSQENLILAVDMGLKETGDWPCLQLALSKASDIPSPASSFDIYKMRVVNGSTGFIQKRHKGEETILLEGGWWGDSSESCLWVAISITLRKCQKDIIKKKNLAEIMKGLKSMEVGHLIIPYNAITLWVYSLAQTLSWLLFKISCPWDILCLTILKSGHLVFNINRHLLRIKKFRVGRDIDSCQVQPHYV